ncbi:MAG: hypothetical protein ACXABG_11095 [Promethearchaeota archaeon]|jgi:hypothetical protein
MGQRYQCLLLFSHGILSNEELIDNLTRKIGFYEERDPKLTLDLWHSLLSFPELFGISVVRRSKPQPFTLVFGSNFEWDDSWLMNAYSGLGFPKDLYLTKGAGPDPLYLREDIDKRIGKHLLFALPNLEKCLNGYRIWHADFTQDNLENKRPGIFNYEKLSVFLQSSTFKESLNNELSSFLNLFTSLLSKLHSNPPTDSDFYLYNQFKSLGLFLEREALRVHIKISHEEKKKYREWIESVKNNEEKKEYPKPEDFIVDEKKIPLNNWITNILHFIDSETPELAYLKEIITKTPPFSHTTIRMYMLTLITQLRKHFKRINTSSFSLAEFEMLDMLIASTNQLFASQVHSDAIYEIKEIPRVPRPDPLMDMFHEALGQVWELQKPEGLDAITKNPYPIEIFFKTLLSDDNNFLLWSQFPTRADLATNLSNITVLLQALIEEIEYYKTYMYNFIVQGFNKTITGESNVLFPGFQPFMLYNTFFDNAFILTELFSLDLEAIDLSMLGNFLPKSMELLNSSELDLLLVPSRSESRILPFTRSDSDTPFYWRMCSSLISTWKIDQLFDLYTRYRASFDKQFKAIIDNEHREMKENYSIE